jgi:hypothetical protein
MEKETALLSEVSVLLSNVSDPDPDWIRIQSGQWIRIQKGQIDSQKLEKVKICFEVLDVLF